tara:strand:- start:346 stop:564 length:219 start_codon:yes stop_codon:yes gene_type:complete
MKFIQHKDNSLDIIFEEDEIKIINDKKKLHLPAITLKHFGNVLSKIVFDWNLRFNDEIKTIGTTTNTEIKGK